MDMNKLQSIAGMRNKGRNKGTRRKELPKKKGGIIGAKCP